MYQMATCIFEKGRHVATYESIKVMAYLDPYFCSIILIPGFHHTIPADARHMLKKCELLFMYKEVFWNQILAPYM